MTGERLPVDELTFLNIEKELNVSDFACIMLITMGFYQTGQDLQKNARIVSDVFIRKDGVFNFKNFKLQSSIQDFRQFNPQRPEIASVLAKIMKVSHQRSRINPRSLVGIESEMLEETASGMFQTVKTEVLKIIDSTAPERFSHGS